jgi:hypothetical protein
VIARSTHRELNVCMINAHKFAEGRNIQRLVHVAAAEAECEVTPRRESTLFRVGRLVVLGVFNFFVLAFLLRPSPLFVDLSLEGGEARSIKKAGVAIIHNIFAGAVQLLFC